MAANSSKLGVTVREAQFQDLPQVRDIGSTVFARTFGHSLPQSELQAYLDTSYSLSSIQDDFANRLKDLIVAVDSKGIILGFALLTQGTSEPCIDHIDSKLELQRIYVGIEHHGRGLGRMLFERAESIGRRQGFEYMWLGVWEENYRAQEVYRKRGYEMVGEHDFKMGNEVQTDWIMVKRL